jgi:hypothetical protein
MEIAPARLVSRDADPSAVSVSHGSHPTTDQRPVAACGRALSSHTSG